MNRTPIHSDEAQRWRRYLARSLSAQPLRLVNEIEVIEQAASTQDQCRSRPNRCPGLAVTALRQTSGRGRLGRPWIDDNGQGVALTVSIQAQPAERLAVATGLAVCGAVENLGARAVRIRWPNDVLIEGRKVAGVLIEIDGDLALVGIGINVKQTSWPADLQDNAISLAQVGVPIARDKVVWAVLEQLDQTLYWSNARLKSEFESRDMLCGTIRTFEHAGRRITGRVQELDPLAGLAILTDDGELIRMPAQTASLMHEDR